MCGGSTKQETTRERVSDERIAEAKSVATEETKATGFDPDVAGSGIDAESVKAFREHLRGPVPFSVVSEFVTQYGTFLVADGKSANEAFDIAYKSRQDNDIVFQMWIAGVSGGMDLAETGRFTGSRPENELLDAIGATL